MPFAPAHAAAYRLSVAPSSNWPVAGAVALGLALGAGSCRGGSGAPLDRPYVEPAKTPPPTGRLATPADLDRDGCEPGALDGVALDGLWYAELDPSAPACWPWDCAPIRDVDVDVVYDAHHARVDANGLFWRNEWTFDDGSRTEAFLLCRADPDGTLHGHTTVCLAWEGTDECWSEPLTLSRHGRSTAADELELDPGLLYVAYRGRVLVLRDLAVP